MLLSIRPAHSGVVVLIMPSLRLSRLRSTAKPRRAPKPAVVELVRRRSRFAPASRLFGLVGWITPRVGSSGKPATSELHTVGFSSRLRCIHDFNVAPVSPLQIPGHGCDCRAVWDIEGYARRRTEHSVPGFTPALHGCSPLLVSGVMNSRKG